MLSIRAQKEALLNRLRVFPSVRSADRHFRRALIYVGLAFPFCCAFLCTHRGAVCALWTKWVSQLSLLVSCVQTVHFSQRLVQQQSPHATGFGLRGVRSFLPEVVGYATLGKWCSLDPRNVSDTFCVHGLQTLEPVCQALELRGPAVCGTEIYNFGK